MNTYAVLVTSRPVLAELEQRLGIPTKEIRGSIDVEFEAQTELLNITVEDPDPELAADVATNLASIVIVQTQRTRAGRDLRVSLFAPAAVPEIPSWLGLLSTPLWREINIALGLIVSFVVGVGLAFLFEYLDTTLYTTEQIEKVTELTKLGEIPIVKKRQQMAALNGNTLHREAFRGHCC
jgi:capsular polysaccharide biosynthesis protein